MPKEKIRRQLLILLASINEDALSLGWQPRSAREACHHNWRSNLPALQILNLVLNNRRLQPTKEFMAFLNARTTLADLYQLGEDLSRGLSKLPFTNDQIEAISESPPRERKEKILEICDSESLKSQLLEEVKKNRGSLFSINFPWWQALFLVLYSHELKVRRSFSKNR